MQGTEEKLNTNPLILVGIYSFYKPGNVSSRKERSLIDQRLGGDWIQRLATTLQVWKQNLTPVSSDRYYQSGENGCNYQASKGCSGLA